MRTLLFLCSGNYYRSRYAELLFNHLADQRGLAWRAASRGLSVDRSNNPGPIAKPTLAALAHSGITPPQAAVERYPAQVSEAELAAAQRVVAVKEAEHRPLLTERFPGWEDRVLYWHVHDLDKATAEEALGALDGLVAGLVEEFAAAEGSPASGR